MCKQIMVIYVFFGTQNTTFYWEDYFFPWLKIDHQVWLPTHNIWYSDRTIIEFFIAAGILFLFLFFPKQNKQNVDYVQNVLISLF